MNPRVPFTRRGLLACTAGFACMTLSACSSMPGILPGTVKNRRKTKPTDINPNFSSYRTMYAAMEDEGHHLPAIPVDKMKNRQLRQVVPDPTGEAPGTVVVDISNHFLYLVLGNGEAIRYGVGLGRDGFEWEGRAVIQWKRKWPRWTPPEEMIAREPELAQYRNGGMAPGSANPLGARALYIFQNNRDTLYRIHGSPEWWTMGRSVSSGCVRMLNQDVIDLYERVPNKTPILVVNNTKGH